MERIIDLVLSCIREHPEGIDTESIRVILNWKHNTQIYICCRQLESQGYVERKGLGRPTLNFPTNKTIQNVPENNEIQNSPTNNVKPQTSHDWSWEDNVQTVVGYLRTQGYEIIRIANTESKELGNDIEARKDNRELWIRVKGFPMKNKKTHINAQAAQWFGSVIFEILSKRGENPEANLAVALPNYDRYRTLSQNVEWLQKPARFSFIWLNEDGTVDWTDTSEQDFLAYCGAPVLSVIQP